MIQFKTIEHFKPGLFQEITKKCYEPLFQYFPDKKAEFHQQWENSDKETFDNPDTIGKCVFVSCINEKPIGFASWDPRQKPLGIIGQNCILPEYQGKGFGKQLINEFILTCKKEGTLRIILETDAECNYGFYENLGFNHIASFGSPLQKEFSRNSGETFIFELKV